MDIVDKISNALERHEKKYKFANLVVCGGNSVLNIFKDLSLKEINWENIMVTLVDERLVPIKHPDSNWFLVKKHLLINAASKAKLLPLSSQTISPEKMQPPFTVMLLSMGDDGHFASIFSNMLNDKHFVDPKGVPQILKTTKQGNPSYCRVTMNLAMILKSKSIFLLVYGQKKLEAFDLAKTNKDLPVNRLLLAAGANLTIDRKKE